MAVVTGFTATYVSDTRINLAWSTGTIPAGVGSLRVYRYEPGGSAKMVASLSTGATSWADTTTRANTAYQYGIVGWDNNDPPTAEVKTSWVTTTPAAPSNVTAARDDAGDAIVTWQNNAPQATSFEVQDGTTPVGTISASPFTDSSPDVMSTHAYRVRAVADGRYSAWSAYSPEITLYAAPLAPSDLAPNGVPQDATQPLTLSWSHNPTDTTPQTEQEVEWRLSGGSFASLGATTSPVESVSTSALPTSGTIEWRVRTKGAHVDWSPWSAVASFSRTSRPTVTITSPAYGATITTATMTVEWSYYHAGSGAQSGWQVEILDGATIVGQGSGVGTEDEWTTGVLPNGTTLTVRVRVREPSGLWSEWESISLDVNYAPPPASTVTAEWVDGFGNVNIEAQPNAGTPATVAHRVERSDDGGNTWVLVGDDLPSPLYFNDWQSPAADTFHYRVSALSALPSATPTVVEVTVPATDVNCVTWLGGGPGFAQVVKLIWNPTWGLNGGRDRALHKFSGRTHPVEFSSVQAPKTFAVQAQIFPEHHNEDASTVDELEDLFDQPGPHLLRTHDGRVMYGTLSALDVSAGLDGILGVSFTITRSDPPTSAQATSLAGYYAPRIAEVAPGVYQFINAEAVEAEPGVYEEVE